MEKNSKIYVAGHGGMVGSAIVRQLKKMGFTNIIGRTRKQLDLMNQSETAVFFEEEKPEYVFMAAARVGGIQANNEYMADFLMENLMIQNNVITMSHRYGVKKLLFLASACIYPKDCIQPMQEEALLTGALEPTNEGYALAKIAGLKACSYYNKQYGADYITAMPANAYGPNDNFDEKQSHVIPALIKRFHQAKEEGAHKVVMWGTGRPMREFLYVDDLADACIFLMENYEGEGFLNIGSGEEITMRELAEVIKRVVGYKGEIQYDLTKPDGMLRRVLNSEKIHKLGWKHRVDMEEGLRREYEWFLQNKKENGGRLS